MSRDLTEKDAGYAGNLARLLQCRYTISMLKLQQSILICAFFVCAGMVSAVETSGTSTAVFTDENYSLYVTYSSRISPGDAVCVNMQITPSRKTAKEPASATQAVLIFNNTRKADFFTLSGARNTLFSGNSAVTLCGMVPVSTWQETGNYELTVMYSAFGFDYMKFSLPVTVVPKDFVSETIPLDASNTAVKTDTSPARLQQIDRLNSILFAINEESVYQFKPFTPPTDAVRRTSFFGDRRIYEYTGGGSSTSLHYGIDYGVPTGTPVYACGSGKVVVAENRISTGWSVVIEHMPGLYSLYYHMDSISVTEGQTVKQQEQIGVSGATGLATGPHLHWEVRLNGEAVSPDFFTDNFPYFE